MTKLFGGTTAVPAPGTNILDGEVLYEEGQTLITSCCRNREEYDKYKAQITDLAVNMGSALRQAYVIVLGWEADTEILECVPAQPSGG